MSGGYFDYKQSHVRYLAEELEEAIHENIDNIPSMILEIMKTTVVNLQECSAALEAIDYYLSGDTGEESFWDHLAKEKKYFKESSMYNNFPVKIK